MSSNDTKQRIFHAAIDLFSSVGYSESTMRTLAAKVGIKTASFYYYYPSKDDLLNDIFDYFMKNDMRYRTSMEKIVQSARLLDVPQLLQMMYIQCVDDADFYQMSKILRIAVGYQFEYPRAKEVFNYIYYDMALGFREAVFAELVRQKVLEPFDCQTVAYLMTSYSMMRFMDVMNHNLPIEQYANYYNGGVDQVIDLLAPRIHKCSS